MISAIGGGQPALLHNAQLRGSIATALALLHTANRPVAHVVFRWAMTQIPASVSRQLHDVHTHLHELTDCATAADVLLLMSMARHHPAFDFQHRVQLTEWLQHSSCRLIQLAVHGSGHRIDPNTASNPAANGSEAGCVRSRSSSAPPANSGAVAQPTAQLVRSTSTSDRTATEHTATNVDDDRNEDNGIPAQSIGTEEEDVSTSTSTANAVVYPTRIELVHSCVTIPRSAAEARQHRVPIRVVTNDRRVFVTRKNYNDFQELHGKVIWRNWTQSFKLLDRYPLSAGCHGNRRVIPYLLSRTTTDFIADDNFEAMWRAQLHEIADYV